LKECRASLDQQGLMPDKVKIAGPGIAHIDFDAKGDPYVNALDSNAVADLGAWANHAYIWNNKLFDSPSGSQAMATAAHLEEASFRSKDPNAKLPWIESEYGASTPDYHGITFADDTAKRAALPYAAREMADTLAFFENGVNALIYWQGKDQYWDKGKWGLLDEKGQPKPVFDALSTLLPKLAENKYRVVTVSPDPTGFTGAAFVDKARLIVALANPTAAQIDATLSITGAKRLRFSDSATFTSGALGSTVLQPDAKGDYHVSLPSDSTITIEFSHR